ncbi:MAG: bifunctional 5,10-methylenetetrahydrofolate dehydrogenase/5,10-methenyltetrahydrofolate cyclohydrolase [Candidatus Omnitrophica bacterium]|nr:bifunctional 5,10-methylenetetrahydrofolate dehydrogenase/5,10-methenyltetrahydrofolate cyclohydrolase [Candidatus Omnitrophota bacterium]
MMANLLQGKTIAEKINQQVSQEVVHLRDKYKLQPMLCAIQVGDDKESTLYLEFQGKVAQRLNIGYLIKKMPKQTTKQELIVLIKQLNNDPQINGIILQLPLPEHLDPNEIRGSLNPAKDVEGVHPENLGNIILKRKGFAPCTACAVMELLKSLDIDLYGKEAVIIGHSEIVGKPLAIMLLNELVTTTVCHIATGKRGVLAEHVKRAEILIVAVGKPNLIKGDWIKPGAIVIDVGINCIDQKIVGDVEFEQAEKKASFITPVPGGVGPVTVALLMQNVMQAAKAQLNLDGE